MKDITEFVDNLQHLIDSAKLLDDILRHYNPHTAQITIPNHELIGMRSILTYGELLETKIRKHLNYST